MKKRLVSRLSLVCAISFGTPLLSAVPSLAQGNNTAASTAQIDSLIADIKAHKQSCDDSVPKPTAFCANEKAELVARQKRLGLSDNTLTDKLKTRGWRWP
jgi:hypothetical protein